MLGGGVEHVLIKAKPKTVCFSHWIEKDDQYRVFFSNLDAAPSVVCPADDEEAQK